MDNLISLIIIIQQAKLGAMVEIKTMANEALLLKLWSRNFFFFHSCRNHDFGGYVMLFMASMVLA